MLLEDQFSARLAIHASPEVDQHFYELAESPLGMLNELQISSPLGDRFLDRVRRF